MEGHFLACILLLSFINGAVFYKPSPMDICLLQVEEGPCLEDVPRFYYNTLTQACEPFSYGGCDGNANNFKSNVACHKTCYKIPKIPRICRLPKNEGLCFGISRRYFFNMTSMKCEVFSYGGCGGNNNNFQEFSSCMEYCSPQTSMPVICQGDSDKGTGSASIPRFYYDSNKKTCKQFEYTGSGGNNNNFVSMESCMSVCTKKSRPQKPSGRIFRKRL
ncbi:tissue factor pathway inhibitor 2 [Silurus meridionalis]|uniref:BPTI/Kunitz inhibitor domain-containing protein n=1 Tax=Silurus meridionalis TaxID=175797 RepID=A0A8T0AKQ9_SILME|nr:tissue factor pathway inhibitor 2 [Silurus meridionalis]XP_046690242.1 tissue factor pathway inhibitor 2 [Silurus meridionalis]KAF7691327.1 hypothetical protein HF521_011624 [Silurus meridionalis]